MIVIADTSPLRHLVAIDKIDILHELYGQIVVPQYVWNELHRPQTPEKVRQWVASCPAWISVREMADVRSDEQLRDLDEGEREAIWLAEELRADLLIIDDKAGWEEATRRDIPVTRTLAVLEIAAERGLLNDYLGTLEQLLKSGFRMSADLYERMRSRHLMRKGSR